MDWRKQGVSQTWPINCKSRDVHVEKLKYNISAILQYHLGSNAEQPPPPPKKKEKRNIMQKCEQTRGLLQQPHVEEVIQYLSLNFWRAQWYYRGQQILFSVNRSLLLSLRVKTTCWGSCGSVSHTHCSSPKLTANSSFFFPFFCICLKKRCYFFSSLFSVFYSTES